ncbi:TlpA family protein disulfide reductase [Mucilaginibacter antarcticus]|uniref:TlpA family protein disulfide reductase n=1 Tax=Mucilaginibacter antarcticus TaxID=1855725 RepID=A0ABW5XT71_9SPHI
MKYAFSIIAMLLTISTLAQKPKIKAVTKVPAAKPAIQPAKSTGFALIKGHINNNDGDFLDYGLEKLLGYTVGSIPVDKNGNFERLIPIDEKYSQIHFRTSGMGVILWLADKDTVTVNWDYRDLQNTLSIIASKPGRTEELVKIDAHRKKFMQPDYDMQVALNDEAMPDSVKFARINAMYNQEIQSLLSGPVYEVSLRKAIDVYFHYANTMSSYRLLGKYDLYITNLTTETKMVPVVNEKLAYKTESMEYYKASSEYRDFVFNYLRFTTPFTSTVTATNGVDYKTLPFSPGWKDYYAGLAAIRLTELRDWFITKSIMTDFSFYSFDDASAIYKDFMGKVQTPFFADTLATYYDNVKRLKPGSPAPMFNLKDENGKMVSLSAFKGKTVYIDFWGVGCGPCIYAIKNYVPQLHEKYKDKNIVFINICVDSDEATWKRSLADLNLHGINLIAEGWTKNATNIAYNINAIPHYYLIDGEGKIVNNNANGPGKGVYPDLDKLIK